MAKKVKFGSSKRYGPRYGQRNKDKVAALEKEHRGRHKCPYCNYIKARRLSKGIWHCEKCKAKFAGKAYTFHTPKAAKEVAKRELEDIEEVEEETKEELPEEVSEEPKAEEAPAEDTEIAEEKEPAEQPEVA